MLPAKDPERDFWSRKLAPVQGFDDLRELNNAPDNDFRDFDDLWAD